MTDATQDGPAFSAARDGVAPPAGPMLAADGTPLKRSLARALRQQKLRAFLLVAPLLFFILIAFVAPIADMLFRSIENPELAGNLPRTTTALVDWDANGGELPGEDIYRALHADLLEAVEAKTHMTIGRRLSFEAPGYSSLFRKTGRRVKRMDAEAPLAEQFADVDKDWADLKTWTLIQHFSGDYTAGYFLRAVDLTSTGEGIERRPENQRIFGFLFTRTLVMSVAITLSCLLLAYPVAWLLANLPARHANLLLILVLLPFWTSLLVRTSAWKVLLQQQGVINDLLVWVGAVADDSRLALINNQTGTIIAMTHILLPFMILPLYSVMKTVPPTYLRAAKSLGATNWTAFWRVYFPQTVPGIGAGAVLVFILAIGYYITPELVGGTSGVFISNQIAYYMNSSNFNWGFAAALGSILLGAVLILYWTYDRIVGIDNVKLG